MLNSVDYYIDNKTLINRYTTNNYLWRHARQQGKFLWRHNSMFISQTQWSIMLAKQLSKYIKRQSRRTRGVLWKFMFYNINTTHGNHVALVDFCGNSCFILHIIHTRDWLLCKTSFYTSHTLITTEITLATPTFV